MGKDNMNAKRALGIVQSTLKAPKGQKNDFGGYMYRSCEDILEAVKPILAEVNAIVILYDEMVECSGNAYVKAVAEFAMVDSDDKISVSAFAREAVDRKGMDDSQITGATSSYARKYALNGLFLIDDTKDSDATNKGGDEPKKPAPKKPTAKPKVVTAESTDDDIQKQIDEARAGTGGPFNGPEEVDESAALEDAPLPEIIKAEGNNIQYKGCISIPQQKRLWAIAKSDKDGHTPISDEEIKSLVRGYDFADINLIKWQSYEEIVKQLS